VSPEVRLSKLFAMWPGQCYGYFRSSNLTSEGRLVPTTTGTVNWDGAADGGTPGLPSKK